MMRTNVPAVRRLPDLETPRLRLRPLERGDEAFLAALDTDPAVMRWVHGGALAPEHARQYAERQVQLAGYRHRFGRWLVELRESRERLGWLEVFKLSGEDRDDLQVGYQFAPDAQGQGYAAEALRAVLREVFRKPDGLDRLAAIVRPENERSRRLLARGGFVPSGEFRLDGAGQACELWWHDGQGLDSD